MHLPDDIWTLILLLLDIPDLRRFRAVCKYFRHLTTSFDTLAFRIELDAAGYVEPSNLRQDITTGQRLAVLREHMSRRQSLVPSRVDTLWDLETDDNPPVSSSSEVLRLAGSMAARWVNENRAGGKRSGRLDVVSFASPNKGIGLSQWSLYEDNLEIDWVWIYPEEDLFVLCQDVIPQAFDGSNVHNTEKILRLYLRTLSSNTPHPNVCQHVLNIYNEVENDTVSVTFSGRLMLVWLYHESRILFYDWKEGSVLIDEAPFTITSAGDMLLVDDLLLVAYPSYCNLSTLLGPVRPNGKYHPWTSVGILEVYSFCLDTGPELTCVAQLDLPSVGHTKPFTGPGSESLESIRGRSLVDMSQFRFRGGNAITFSSRSSTPIPCVFEVPNSERVIQLSIHFESSSQTEGRHPSNSYSLLIPLDNILRAIPRSPCVADYISWDKWGTNARWIHCGEEKGQGRWRESFVTGPRGVLTDWHLCEVGDCKCPDSTRPPFSISVIELKTRPHAYRQIFAEESADFETTNSWIQGLLPALTSSDFGKIKECLEFRDKSTMQTDYLMSEFKHEILAAISPDEFPTIWTTDEHILIAKWAEGDISRIKSLTVFTF